MTITGFMDKGRQWGVFYKAAGIAAIIIVSLIPVQAFIFFAWPPPTSVTDYFTLFQRNPVLGLLDLDLLLTFDYTLFILIYLVLYNVLKRTSEPMVAIGLASGLISLVLYFVSREACFDMFSLGRQYAQAATAEEQAILEAAGKTLLTMYNGTSFNLSYFFGMVATITISFAMLQSRIFSKTTAYMGILSGVLMLVPPTAGTAGLVLSFLSLLPTIPWLLLTARKLFQLSKAMKAR